MEFFLGAFEREWERQRAALLHDVQMGRVTEVDWDWPRRGGAAGLPYDSPAGARGWRGPEAGQGSIRGRAGRSMRLRFAALARGSQPAVVKLASYGGGIRAVAMMSYASRNGELAVENEKGERIAGKAALAQQRSEWEHLFDNRAASRDIGIFHVDIEEASKAAGQDQDQDKIVRETLRSAFGDRHFVYAFKEKDGGQLEARGVLVLRDREGERLTGDVKASLIVQQRFDESDIGNLVHARFRFHGYGNGVEFGTARVRELVGSHQGEVRDDAGRPIDSLEQAGDLVQKQWRKDLHSRKGRDVMHLIVSARAGTDETAFRNTVRDFLGEQFAGHRYIFAMHDPSDDPKEIRQGGKRPHIHAHAIVTMRSETAERIETSPQMFREWRSLMAEKAREHGIAMELTDRRDRASAPAYARNQVRPVSYAGRTEHEGTSEFAQVRYEAKRSNRPHAVRSDRSTAYAAEAAQAWRVLAREDDATSVADFAGKQMERIQTALRQSQFDIENTIQNVETTNLRTNMVMLRELIGGEEAPMREMTRPEFEAYEKRVEAVLADVETSVGPSERIDFEEVAAAARDIVNIRREYLEFTEQQADAPPPGGRPETENDDWNRAVARHGDEAVPDNDVLLEIETAREAIDRATYEDRDTAPGEANLRSQLEQATSLAAAGNAWLRGISETDPELRQAIENERGGARVERAATDRTYGGEGDRPNDQFATVAAGEAPVATRTANAAPGSAEADSVQRSDPLRDNELDRSESDHAGTEEQAPIVDDRRMSRERDGSGHTPPSVDRASLPSDPPQQQVPRLRELESEAEERDDREGDELER